MSEPIVFDYANVMSSAVGRKHGIAPRMLDEIAPLAKSYTEELASEREAGGHAFRELPFDRNTVDQVKSLAGDLQETFDNFVVLGIGGSALGAIALHTALHHPFHNQLPREQRKAPRLFVLDNIDPSLIEGLLDVIDLKETVFNVITKSGSTAETMSQFLYFRRVLIDRLGEGHRQRLILTTDPEKGDLRQIVSEEGYRSLEIPPGVGGRFSVMSVVGLLPAAATGIDIDDLLAGGAAMDSRCRTAELRENPAHLGAVIQFLMDTKKKKRLSVMMPYAQALRDVSDWYRQLWAESLGKKHSLQREVVHVGPTPIKALGVTDQHSQIQLYVEGPNDKIVTFIAAEQSDREPQIPEDLSDFGSTGYLGGHSFAELYEMELQGTQTALTAAQRPHCTISLPDISPHSMGQLLYMLEVQTAFAGKLYQINPYDQPGVEGGKIATYALMGRPGYEKVRKDLSRRKRGVDRYRA